MFVLGNLFLALAKILDIGITIFYWLIIVRALISWVNPDPYNPIVQFLYKTTEPILEPIRRLIPVHYSIGIDISPLIAFFILIFLRIFLVNTLLGIAARLT